jgi:hypothetical protein
MQTPESSLEALAKRVAKLEAQNRRLKKAGIASFIVASAVIAMGQAPAKKVIEANEFVLQDASGKARARLSMETTDKPALTFLRDQTTPTASLTGGDEPFLTLNRAGTAEQVQLGANKEFVGLAIYEKEIRAGLSMQKGATALDLFDASGQPKVTLNFSSLGSGFTMFDPHDKASLSMSVSPAVGGPVFSMFDSTGGSRVTLVTPDGEPSLKLEDKEGFAATLGQADLLVPGTGRKENTSAASIVLFGKDKKVLWSAP